VGQRGDELHCTCTGAITTALMGLGSLLALLAVVSFSPMMALGGTISKGVIGSILGLAVAIAFAYMALSRRRRHGYFVLDGQYQTLRQYRGNRVVREFVLGDVMRVWLVADFTDGLRALNGPPSWLQIALRTGEIFRLAKGNREELLPVCRAVRRIGWGPEAIVDV
jgi:hypothetical protein